MLICHENNKNYDILQFYITQKKLFCGHKCFIFNCSIYQTESKIQILGNESWACIWSFLEKIEIYICAGQKSLGLCFFFARPSSHKTAFGVENMWVGALR